MIHVSFTDQWPTFLDENGKPLIGRVKFFNADSTQFKSIFYDMQGEVQGENPQYTLQDGRLEHQIFLGAGVYTCRVEKFSGEDASSMRDHANDNTYWPNYKTFKVYGGAEEIEGGGDLAEGFCDTIAALRLVDPSEHGVVSVVGYYSKEDGIEPRTYVWVDGNSDSEDFGSTIVSSVSGYTNSGRWKLCETPIVCATTFGVFPNRNSTISHSDLSTKATALAAYAGSSPIVSMIHFNRGNYEFAEGTRLSFTKKVIAGDANVSNRYLRFGMFVENGQTPQGTIEIAFIGGLELEQKAPICTNEADNYTTFSFGAGFVRTSWLKNIEKHITASLPYEGLTIILDKSSANTFYNNGQTIKNWHFKGCDKALYQVVGSNALFQSCSFEGKCFQVNIARFLDCGTLYQECICANDTKITDNVIWGSTGEIKSKGTTFVCNDIRMTKLYTGVVDNSCIKAIGDDAKIVSASALTFKYLDKDWQLHGRIGFENSDTLYASQYPTFNNCVDYALAYSKEIDLEKLSRSYTIDTTGVSATRLFVFKNGTLTLTKTGSAVEDVVKLNGVTLSVDSSFNKLTLDIENSSVTGIGFVYSNNAIKLYSKNSSLTISENSRLYLGNASLINTQILGSVEIRPENGVFNQSFVNCIFFSQLRVATDVQNALVYIKVVGCSFSIANNGTPLSAILPVVQSTPIQGSFADETKLTYSIVGNVLFGDATMLPIDKAVIPIEADSDVVEVQKPISEFEDRLFHFGALIRFRVYSDKCRDVAYNRQSILQIEDETIDHIVNLDTHDNYSYRFVYVVERM